MKICLFDHHNTPYPVGCNGEKSNKAYFTSGGLERVNNMLFKYFVDSGHDVTLIINNVQEYKYKNAKIIQLPYDELQNIRLGRKNILKEIDCDIFHTYTSGPNQNFDFNGYKGKWIALCGGHMEEVGAPHQIFVCNNQYRLHQKNYNCDTKCNKCYICYLGVDTDIHYPINGTNDKIIWFSNLRSDKNPQILPKLAELIQEPIYIYGCIEGNEELFNTSIKPYLGHLLHYCGPITSDEQKREMFSNAKLYLHTPDTFEEPFGLTIAEAQACGVSVVGFKKGSLPEIAYNSDRQLASSIEEMAEIIKEKKYTTDKNKVANWTKNKFSIEEMGKRFLSIYEQALSTSF